MSGRINQPINQVKLTNVAVVRMNRQGKRFEIACYRNKVVNWRQGTEVDLDEVLQTDRIFTNVSKGEFASADLLQKCFDTTDPEVIAKMILAKGQVQISDLERSQKYESMQREIATQISQQCVNPTTSYPYTVAQIRQAMREANYIVHPTRSIKRQFLDCVKLIQSKGVLKLERAKMELSLVVEKDDVDRIQDELRTSLKVQPTKQATDNDGGLSLTLLVDPSLYRQLQDVLKQSYPSARLEILQQVVKREGDSDLVEALHEEGYNTLGMNQLSVREESEDGEDDHEEAIDSQPVKKSNRKKTKKEKRREKERAAAQARQQEQARNREDETTSRTMSTPAAPASSGGGKSCNTCGGAFPNAADYRAHFRSDWHRYNQKLKLKGLAPVSEREFLACDADAFFQDFE